MRISAKARYGLAAMVSMAQDYEAGECITIISLSEKLTISKIYLEQVFSLLKRAGIVTSIKGPQGGYLLAKAPRDISVYDILSALEIALFEKTEPTVPKSSGDIEKAMQEMVFEKMDDSVAQSLTDLSLDDMVHQIETYRNDKNYMYYI